MHTHPPQICGANKLFLTTCTILCSATQTYCLAQKIQFWLSPRCYASVFNSDTEKSFEGHFYSFCSFFQAPCRELQGHMAPERWHKAFSINFFGPLKLLRLILQMGCREPCAVIKALPFTLCLGLHNALTALQLPGTAAILRPKLQPG